MSSTAAVLVSPHRHNKQGDGQQLSDAARKKGSRARWQKKRRKIYKKILGGVRDFPLGSPQSRRRAKCMAYPAVRCDRGYKIARGANPD